MEYAKTSRGTVLQREGREEFYIEGSVEFRYRVWCGGQPCWKTPTGAEPMVAVQFKNKRVEYYVNTQMLRLQPGDLVTVSTSPGHDVGAVALTGWPAYREYVKSREDREGPQLEIFRLSTRNDIDRWIANVAKEHEALEATRGEAQALGLEMKVFDVEYQGDGNKLTVFYSSEKRIDFRTLVKLLADRFSVRIQMQQLGVRQEPARLGGIGPCGQELCCSRWMRSTPPVLSSTMKVQDLQVLACTGQCGKLKCCLNFELDSYVEARGKMPKVKEPLRFEESCLYYVKSDIFRQLMWFSATPKSTMNLVMLTVDEVRDVMEKNARGEAAQPLDKVRSQRNEKATTSSRVENVIEADSITRFDNPRPKTKKGKKKRRPQAAPPASPEAQQQAADVPMKAPNINGERPPKGNPPTNGRQRDISASSPSPFPKQQGKHSPRPAGQDQQNSANAAVNRRDDGVGNAEPTESGNGEKHAAPPRKSRNQRRGNVRPSRPHRDSDGSPDGPSTPGK